MDLILWRHAEAVEEASVALDMRRELTHRGEKQAARMSAWLDRQLPENAKVFCSPARRTEQTALALGRKYRVKAELGPEGTVEELLQLVQWPEAKSTTVVVGHQPTLGRTVSQLLGLKDQDCALRKGAVWWLRTRERNGILQTVLICAQSPDTL